MAFDPDTFKPADANALFEGILDELGVVALADFKAVKKAAEADLKILAEKAWKTQLYLATDMITAEEAEIALHTQELFLNNIFLRIKFSTRVAAQHALNAVFRVINAAIKNYTGVDLGF